MLSAPLPTRFDLPPEITGQLQNVPLECVHWPLYSSAAYDAAVIPRQVQLFNYLRGQTVSGAGTGATSASRWHTNMEAVQTIPAPKTFLVCGIRVMVSPLAVTTTTALADDTVGTAVAALDQVDDLLKFFHTLCLRFKIGDSIYVEAPIWMMPQNNGIGGVASTSVHSNAAATLQTRVALHTRGVAYDFGDSPSARRPILWNQQSFTCELLAEFATNPTLTDNKLVRVTLDGIMGREIQ